MQAQRLQRWSHIVKMLYECFVFAGMLVFVHPINYTKTDNEGEVVIYCCADAGVHVLPLHVFRQQ